MARLRNLFLKPPGIETVFVQFWDRDERVFTGNAPEALYRPDPSARAVLDGLAAAMEGSVYEEDELVAARRNVRGRLGSGPTVVRGERESRIALAPLLLVLWQRDR